MPKEKKSNSNYADVVGDALLDYYKGNKTSKIIVISSIAEDDEIAIDYLFRAENKLPKLEEVALKLCKGKVLNVGAGSGCHSVILQQKGFDVNSIDVSKGAVYVMQERGLPAQEKNYYEVKGSYDTLLFLMNGLGIAEDLKGLEKFLLKAKELLNTNGQILVDSSDISYMFKQNDGSMWVDLNSNYYGEVEYHMEYNNRKGEPFKWLFADFETLKDVATQLDMQCEKVFEDEQNQYLARLSF